MAFFGMELDAENIPPADRGQNRPAVVGDADNIFLVGTMTVVGMNEIKPVLLPVFRGKKRVVPRDSDDIPAHVWNLER